MRILHCPDMDQLVAPLAETLAVPVSDPFASEIIVVPTLDVARYLQRELARHLGSTGADDGIVANISFLYPRQIINLPADGSMRVSSSPWDADRLVWEVVAAAADAAVAIPGTASRRLSVCGRAASLFDRYATHRPHMLAKWAGGQKFFVNDEPSLHWQVDLYRAVWTALAARTGGRRAIDDMERWREAISSGMVDLPERISVFGVDSVAPAARDILAVLSEHLPVTVYLVHPRAHQWPNPIPADTARTASQTPATHPLLARWGAQLLEAGATLGHLPREAVAPVRRHDSLLHRLQRGIIEDSPPNPSDTDPGEMFGDGTVQVHACYGLTRQAEALRDALLHLLDAHPHIRARDIAIVCPDVALAAPVLTSTFAGDGGLPRLPISATTGSVTDPDAVTEAFDALLELLTSRCTASEIVDVLRLEPVARTFGIDSEGLERIAEWGDRLSVRFGLDGAHRARWSLPAHIVDGTWEAAMRQLMMGVAVPAETPILGPGEVVPFDGIEGSDLDTAGALAEFLCRLRSCITSISTDPDHVPLGVWFDVLGRLVDDFFSVPARDAEALGALRGAVEDLRRETAEAGLAATEGFPIGDLVALCRGRLARGSNSYFSRGEAVTLAPLGEVRHVPFEVVCIFDANEDAFTGARLDGDDVLAREPMVGEPIYSAAGRLHLLDALLAARSHLIITCNGFDMGTNREIPLAVPVSELLDVAAAHAADAPGRVRLQATHPRHNFDAATMTPGLVIADGPFTHDPNAPVALAALDRGRTESASVPDANDVRRADLEPIRELRQLVRLVKNPVEYHYRDVLKVRLPEPKDRTAPWEAHHMDADGVLRLTLAPLEESGEGRRLLGAVAGGSEGVSEAISAWATVRRKTGALPPGELGRLVVEDLSRQVEEMIEVLPPHLRSLRGEDVDCEIVFNHMPATLRVTEVVPASDSHPTAFARVNFRKFSEATLSEVWAELTILTIARRGEPIEAHVVSRPADPKKSPPATVLTMAGRSDDERLENARRALSCLEGLHRAACAGPIPVFATASHALHRSGPNKVTKKLETDLGKSAELHHVYGAMTADEILAMEATPQDTDLLGPGSPRANSKARLYAEHLWGCFEATTTPVTGVTDEDGGDSDE